MEKSKKDLVTGKVFHWNEDTLMHFNFVEKYVSDEELRKDILDFVEINCSLEEGETDEELAEDLYRQCLTYKIES